MNSCSECRYSNTGGVDPQTLTALLECRRFPPTTQALANPQGYQRVSFFPPVVPEFSCGEFAPKLLVTN